MNRGTLDALDRAILFRLQEDGRRAITDIADEVGVADNTVRNRIIDLEEAGVLRGYAAEIDYDGAGVPHYYMFMCTARVAEREELAAEVRRLPGVVEVITLMTGQYNVLVLAAGTTKRDVTDLAYRLDDAGLAIEREHLVWEHTRQPFEGFRPEDR